MTVRLCMPWCLGLEQFLSTFVYLKVIGELELKIHEYHWYRVIVRQQDVAVVLDVGEKEAQMGQRIQLTGATASETISLQCQVG